MSGKNELGAALLALTFLVARPVFGQSLDLKTLDKFAAKASETVDVTLDGPLLKMAAKFLSNDSPDEARIKKLVGGLKGIYVKSFEFDEAGLFTEKDVMGIRSQLHAPEWSRIVGVRSKRDGENVEVFIRTGSGGQAGGLAIIAAEPKELTVVQLVGSIDLDELSSLGGSFGIPKLDLERNSPPSKGEKKEAK
jgi:uncharacterized protein DUF4252